LKEPRLYDKKIKLEQTKSKTSTSLENVASCIAMTHQQVM